MIGTMPKSQDIHLSDAGLRSQFVSLFTSGDYTGAFDILNNNPQLDNKKIVADALNALNVAITYLENLYYTNVEDFLASELVRLQTAIDRYRKIGTYSGAVQYQVNNFVIYNSLAYMCIATPPIGTLPTDTTYWEEVGLKGDKGDKGDVGKAGENGKDGKDAFIDVQCNTEKNRWEIKLSPLDKWQVLNGESVKCLMEQEVK